MQGSAGEQIKAGETMIPSQMLKGTLEGCILAVISKDETYGYEISRQLGEYGFGSIAEDLSPAAEAGEKRARHSRVPPVGAGS